MLAVLINGVRLLDAQHAVSVEDRGLAYGDGVFETMLLRDGAIRFLSDHLERLRIGCQRLGFDAPADATIRRDIATVSADQRAGIVKLIVTRGVAGRGYRAADALTPTRIAILHAAVMERAGEAVAVRWCDTRLPRNPRLAGIKHLNRLEHVLAQNEWHDAAVAEGLMLDTEGELVCATAGNIFVVAGGVLRTPDLRFAGVRGIMRQRVLNAAKQLDIETDESALRPEDVMTAGEVFLTNAIRGIRPVRTLGDRHWVVGPVTLRLQRATESTK